MFLVSLRPRDLSPLSETGIQRSPLGSGRHTTTLLVHPETGTQGLTRGPRVSPEVPCRTPTPRRSPATTSRLTGRVPDRWSFTDPDRRHPPLTDTKKEVVRRRLLNSLHGPRQPPRSIPSPTFPWTRTGVSEYVCVTTPGPHRSVQKNF